MSLIYHVTTPADWTQALQQGDYQSPSLTLEGFIHCSQAHQVSGVLQRYFSGQKGLIKLVIDTDKLSSQLVMEWSPSGADTFPHIYGPINLEAVVEIIEL